MNAHPAASLFPVMEGADLEALAADIQTNGLLVPIVLHEGLVLDGRNRLAACELAGVEPAFVGWPGAGDPMSWVVSQNLHRRHLSEGQRAMIAARLATMKQGTRTDLAPIGAKSQSDVASLLNVARRSVQRARTVQERGAPELVAAVDAGEVAVSRAAQIARLPEEEQAPAIQEVRKPHVANNSGCNEWYTPPHVIAVARAVMGDIDLDPASSAIANKSVRAKRYFDIETDGLAHGWAGRVWMNPPYSSDLVIRFCEKLIEQLGRQDGVVEACVLVNNATETAAGQLMLSRSTAACFPSGRIRYLAPETDMPSKTPLQGQMLVYFGPHADAFEREARTLGVVLMGPRR